MYGTLSGNIAAVIYFLCFQFCGIIISDGLFYREKKLIRLLIGSVCGSFLLMWLPVITSFIMGFNTGSHLVALVLLVIIMLLTYLFTVKRKRSFIFFGGESVKSVFSLIGKNIVFVVLFIALMVFYILLLDNHVLDIRADAVYCGQCTYGDMNMHLGFITSLANQGTFPPDYSIMPGEKLCYPFLCDSISSSLYIFGCSLKLAYCLPVIFAFAQVLGGFYAFAYQWLRDKAKTVLAFVLFFLNGGFGFLYFVNVIGDGGHTINEIFTEFYHTPTNFVEYNIRWVNVIADMLLPQRATLFGWSILFTVLFILWRAHFEGKKNYFFYVGFLAGGLVMIHTHSFLALGIVCAVWLLFNMVDTADIKPVVSVKVSFFARAVLLAVSILIMSVLRMIDLKSDVNTDIWFAIGLGGIAVYAVVIIYLAVIIVRKNKAGEILKTWGAFLAVVLPLALIQLFIWTFNQATGDNFVRGQFNWANIDDQYILFYLKNIGLVMLFIIIALLISKKKDFRLAMCGIGIWFIAEFLGFQPNSYDNNKLLYVGFIFLLIPAASIMIEIYKRIKIRAVAVISAVLVIFVCTVSGVLTLGREYVSEYQLYGTEYIGIVDYINESDIPKDAVILTNNNHNNAIASLTGRNIVVGTGTFLYYHGFNISEREAQLKLMFENPESNVELFSQYNVKYVVIGSYEKYNFEIDYEWFSEHGRVLCESNNAVLLELIY